MDLLSVFKRGSAAAGSVDPAPSLDSVATARKRARQRLIGATILVIIAVVAFPLVFDSAPRPISVDVPIDIPRKEGAPPLAMPTGRAANGDAAASSASAPVVAGAAAGAASSAVITENSGDAGSEIKPPVPDARAAIGKPGPPHVARPPAKVPERVATTLALDKPAVAVKPEATRSADEANRARALLENKPVARAEAAAPAVAARPPVTAAPAAPTVTPSSDTRFAIQVAAFSSESPAQDMRNKLEKAGVKSYTQVIDTPQGKRIRVRVGPFSTRDEAERAAGKIKSAGLPSSIVPL